MSGQRIIVKFKPVDPYSDDTIMSLVDEVQASVPALSLVRPPSRSGRALFTIQGDLSVAEVTNELSLIDKIAYVEADTIDHSA